MRRRTRSSWDPSIAGWQLRLRQQAAIAVLHGRFQGGTCSGGVPHPEPQEEVAIFLSVAPIVVREAVDRSRGLSG